MTLSEPGLQLIQGASASQILYTCLAAAVAAYPEAFKEIQFPKQARDFKRQYAAVLPRFEAARINQPNRADIARLLAETFQAQMVYHSDAGTQSLQDHLATPSQALPLERLPGNCQPGWQPNLHFLGQDWADLTRLGEALSSKNVISRDAKTALDWLAQNLGRPATRRSVAAQGCDLWRQRRDGPDHTIQRSRRRDSLARSDGPNDPCGLPASRRRCSICRRRRQSAHPTR